MQDETCFLEELDHGTQDIDTHGLRTAKAQDLAAMPDVFREPQVYSDTGDSSYIVRKAVMEFWRSRGIEKSLFLQPVLIAESEQHEGYLKLWRETQAALSFSPSNRIV